MNLSNPHNRLGFALAVIIIIAAGAALYPHTNPARTEVDVGVYWGKEERNDSLEGVPKEEARSIKQMVQTESTMPEEKKISGAVFRTSHGDIEFAFFTDKAPKTVENFVKLAQSGFYDSTKFHRVIKDFMIQGGDPLSKDDAKQDFWGTGGPGYQFGDEINDERFVRGAVAMANSGPNTNGSQFFIVTAGATPWLDGKHTVFGRVVKGMDVVDKIERVETGERDIPKTPVIIERAILR